MSEMIMPIVVLLPIVFGLTIPFVPLKTKKAKMFYVEGIVLVTSILAILMLFNQPTAEFTLFRFTDYLNVSFRLDGVGSVFVGICALLWPLAT